MVYSSRDMAYELQLDEYDNVTNAADASGNVWSYVYGYNSVRLEETAAMGGRENVLTRHVDGFQRSIGYALAVDGVANGGVGYAYDAENRICGIAVTNVVGKSLSVEYVHDAGYNYGYTITMPNGGVLRRVVERDQFRRGLVTNCSTYHGNTLVDSYAYAYDAGGRPVTRNDDIFGYDARDQVTYAAIGANVYIHAYDGIGNHVLSGVNSVTNLMENNQLNQLERIVSADSSTTNTINWNANGGMARDDRWTYTYDAEDQLVAVTSRSRTNGAIRVRNAYDYRHRRIAKVVERLAVTPAPPPALPVTLERWDLVERRNFVWDDWNIIHEHVTAVDGVTTNVTEVQYFWGLDLSGTLQGAGGVGGLLAVSRDGNFYFSVYDNNGNVMKYVDESGTVVASYAYDDFSKIVSQTGTLADAFAFRFSTKYYDRETELSVYQLRCYKPGNICWINRDPIEEDGGDNLYLYCNNSPLVEYDTRGEVSMRSLVLSNLGYDQIIYLFRPYGLPVPAIGARFQIQAYLSGNYSVCCKDGKAKNYAHGGIGAEAFLTWGVGTTRKVKGRDRNKPDEFRPGYKNKDNPTYPPDSGYRSRSWHVDSTPIKECPQRGLHFSEFRGEIFLRGSIGAGVGVQANLQKKIFPDTDLSTGWSFSSSVALRVYGASVDVGGGVFAQWTYFEE